MDSPIGTGLETLTVGFVHPFKTLKAAVGEGTVKELRKEFMSKPLGEQLTGVGLATVGYTGVGKAVQLAKAGKLASVAKSLIPKTTKGRVIAGVASVPLAGALISSPGSTLGKVAGAPGELAKFGGDIGKVVQEPSLENIKELITESPLLIGAGALIGASTIGKGVIPAAGQVAAAKILTGDKTPPISSGTPVTTPTTSPVILPTRTSVSATTKRRKYKRRTNGTKVSQRVNINIGRNIRYKTKKYINKR